MIPYLNVRLSILQWLQCFVWGVWLVSAGSYMIATLGFSGREVGLIYASVAIAATITPLFLGLLADRLFSSERLLGTLHIVGAFLLYFAAYQTSFSMLYTILLVYLLCYLPTFGLANALCFHHIKDSKADFPKVRVWGTVAWVAAGLLVSYLNIEEKNTQFLIASGASLILGLYCFTLPHTPPSKDKSASFLKSIFSDEIKQIFSNNSFKIMVISIALICIPLSYYYSFVNPFLNEIGISNSAAKMSIGQMTEIFLILAIPWLFRVLRLKTIIFLGLLAWGVRYGLFILGADWNAEWLLILGLALHGVAYTFSMLCAQIYIDDIFPNHLRSTAQGFFSLLTLGLMALVGTFIAGETVNFFTDANGVHDWQSIWLFPCFFGIGVAIFFWIFFRNNSKA